MRNHLATLVEDFRRNASGIAVVSHRGNRRFAATYGDVAQLAGRFAAALDTRGIAPGDRVVLWGANSAEWIGVFFGCLLRGVLAVPLDAAGSHAFVDRVIKDVSPKLIVGDALLLAQIEVGLPRLTFRELDARLPIEPNYTVQAEVSRHTPFQIVFTSGTTSEPKGIVHTHGNVLASVTPIELEIHKYLKYERFVHPLRFMHTLPLSHVFGQFMGLWLPGMLAAELHFSDQLEARRITELIHDERISVLVAVPRVLQLLRVHLLARFEGLAEDVTQAQSLSMVKRWWHSRRVHHALGWKFWAVISGGAALAPDLEEFWNRLGLALIQGYGMTETTALVTLNHPFKIGKGTIGKTLPGREVKLSQDGEILVRGDVVASSTWQGGGLHRNEQEWLPTGDLAEENGQGELRFLGRKGDVIVTGAGMNVHPDDLESIMKSQAGILDCVVVPFQTPAGPEPIAVVLSTRSENELREAVSKANQHLAAYQQMRRVLRWPNPSFPYTPTGKLLRREIVQWASTHASYTNGSQPAHPAATATATRDIVLETIAAVTGQSPSTESEDLLLTEDLGLDSLGRVQLQTSLEEKFDIELADDAVAQLKTLGELRAALSAATVTAFRPNGKSISTLEPVPVGSNGNGHDRNGRLSNSESNGNHDPAVDETAGSNIVAVVEAESEPRSDQPQAREQTGHAYPRWPWNVFIQGLRVFFLESILRPLVWLLGAPKIDLRLTEELRGPLLIIANHVTAYDAALILYALPSHLRHKVAIAMSGEMLLDFRRGRNGGNWLVNLTGPLAYLLVTAFFNVFPLPRLRGFRKSFMHAGAAMDRGYSVLVFPEGARNGKDNLQPFRQGIGLLAQESQVSVLPVALTGLGQLACENGTRTGSWFRSGRILIRVGNPIPIGDLDDPAALTEKFENAVRELFLA